MHKSTDVFSIISGRKIQHLNDNIEALSIHLTNENIKEIEGAVPLGIGFPQSLLGGDDGATASPHILLNNNIGHFDWVETPKGATL